VVGCHGDREPPVDPDLRDGRVADPELQPAEHFRAPDPVDLVVGFLTNF